MIPGFDFCFLSILSLQLRKGIGEKICLAEKAGNCAVKSKGFSMGNRTAVLQRCPLDLQGQR